MDAKDFKDIQKSFQHYRLVLPTILNGKTLPMDAKDFKDIQEGFRRHSQALPENIQSVKIGSFWNVPHNEFFEWNYFPVSKNIISIRFWFFVSKPNKDRVKITFFQIINKRSITTSFKDVLQKIQKILDFQEKNIRKLHADFPYILINNLIETQNLTPELQKILIESSEFSLCKSQETFTLKIEKKGNLHLLDLKDKKGIIQRFYRNQFFKIHGKHYFVRNTKPLKIEIDTKEKDIDFTEDLTIQNTIRNFHTLLKLTQEKKDNPRKIQFPKP